LYDSPFKFSGTVTKVEIDVQPANLSAADVKKLELAHVQAIFSKE
jgi:hypothetical protein